MKRWYVVQVYAGYENNIKKDLQKRIEEHGLQDNFGEILIPLAKMKQFFDAVGEEEDQQLFPGYMLIQMLAAQESIRLVMTTSRIFRFLGGREPMPISQKEADRILAQIRGEVLVARDKHDFEVGKEIEIKDGPFSGFVGIIDKIDQESEKLTVMVSIFGRMTPVELSFDQIKR